MLERADKSVREWNFSPRRASWDRSEERWNKISRPSARKISGENNRPIYFPRFSIYPVAHGMNRIGKEEKRGLFIGRDTVSNSRGNDDGLLPVYLSRHRRELNRERWSRATVSKWREDREKERGKFSITRLSVSFEREEGKKKLEIGNSKHASNNGQDFKSLNPMSSFFSSGWKAKYAASSAITKYKDGKNRKIWNS